jgi:hypothetical protein
VPLIARGRWSENQGNCVAKDDAAFKRPNRVIELNRSRGRALRGVARPVAYTGERLSG